MTVTWQIHHSLHSAWSELPQQTRSDEGELHLRKKTKAQIPHNPFCDGHNGFFFVLFILLINIDIENPSTNTGSYYEKFLIRIVSLIHIGHTRPITKAISVQAVTLSPLHCLGQRQKSDKAFERAWADHLWIFFYGKCCCQVKWLPHQLLPGYG